MKIHDWFYEKNVYKFYFKLSKMINNYPEFYFKPVDYASGLLYYRGHILMELYTSERRIYLTYDIIAHEVDNNSQADNKLKHEYKKFINPYIYKKRLDFIKLPITMDNMYMVLDYIESVQYKIDSGFEKYIDVLEKEGFDSKSDTGYLEIVISNYFSFNNLRELLDCYNELYSLLHFVLTNTSDLINTSYENYDNSTKSMVVESIHVASEGILVAVGIGLIVEAIKSLIIFILSPKAERSEYERRRSVIHEDLLRSNFLDNEYEIYNTLHMLDLYYKQLELCHNNCRHYIEQRVETLIYRIEKLQGTNKVNLLV